MNRTKQNGGALLMVMLIFLIMTTMLALASSNDSTLQIIIAKNFQDSTTALVQADNGLAETKSLLVYDQDIARPVVEDVIANGEFTFCNGEGLGTTGTACPDSAMGDSRYDVTISNYYTYIPDGQTIATMRVMDIESVGTTVTNARRTVLSHAIALFMDLPTNAALSLYDTGDLTMNGAPDIDGKDWHVPDTFACNGNACAGSLNPFGTDVTGLYSESATNQILNGIPAITGSPAEQVGGSSYDAAYWAEYVAQATLLADTVNGVGAGWGTRDNPVVHVVDADLAVMGNTDGAGILIVHGAEANLALGGTFHFEGIILVLSETGATISMGGTSRVFGAMVVVGPNANINFTGGGTPEILHSSEAINQLGQSQSWRVVTWAEQM